MKTRVIIQDKVKKEREEKELMGVTFKPNIMKANPVPMERPKGFEIAVERMKIAQDQKEIKKILYDNIGRPGRNAAIFQEIDKAYSRNVSKEPQAVQRSGSHGIKKASEPKKSLKEKKKSELIINVEITVAPGKVGYLPLHADDSPTELASSFSKIYSMSDEQRAVLKGILVSYKQKHASTNCDQE